MFFRPEATPHETLDDFLGNATEIAANKHKEAKSLL